MSESEIQLSFYGDANNLQGLLKQYPFFSPKFSLAPLVPALPPPIHLWNHLHSLFQEKGRQNLKYRSNCSALRHFIKINSYLNVKYLYRKKIQKIQKDLIVHKSPPSFPPTHQHSFSLSFSSIYTNSTQFKLLYTLLFSNNTFAIVLDWYIFNYLIIFNQLQ